MQGTRCHVLGATARVTSSFQSRYWRAVKIKANLKKSDIIFKRADAWPLMSSVWPTVAICVGYVYFVKVLGPR